MGGNMFKIFMMLVSVLVFNLQAAQTTKLTQEQLDQAMAPIALYPDALLSQILMATTYPNQIKEAVLWSKTNDGKIKGDDAVKAVEDQNWDPSVASLVAFPQVLDMMGKEAKWVDSVGSAFLVEPDAVMDTIQSLRKKAKDAGNLETSKEQTVKEETKEETTTIIIQESSPQTVYVPVYNPMYVYGPWWYPTFPPFYYYPPYYRPLPGVYFGFAVGVVVGSALWGGFNWHHRDININVNRYNKINVNNRLNVKGNRASWKNNVRHNHPRVNDRTRNIQRDKAKQTLNNKGLNLSKERKNLSGARGDKLRDSLNKGNFKNYDLNKNAFNGVSKPNRSKLEAKRGDFSRSHTLNHSGRQQSLPQRSTFDNRSQFNRSNFGASHSGFRSGGMGGRPHMRRR